MEVPVTSPLGPRKPDVVCRVGTPADRTSGSTRGKSDLPCTRRALPGPLHLFEGTRDTERTTAERPMSFGRRHAWGDRRLTRRSPLRPTTGPAVSSHFARTLRTSSVSTGPTPVAVGVVRRGLPSVPETSFRPLPCPHCSPES